MGSPPELEAVEERQERGIPLTDTERVFEELPEVFGHHDLNRALGYDLDRGSARRNLQLLIEDGVLAAEQSESGHVRLLYRKLRATLPEVED